MEFRKAISDIWTKKSWLTRVPTGLIDQEIPGSQAIRYVIPFIVHLVLKF